MYPRKSADVDDAHSDRSSATCQSDDDGSAEVEVALGPLSETHFLTVTESQIEITPFNGYDSVLIMLHGIGDSASSWLPYAVRRGQKLPGTKLLLLQAPERRVTAMLGMRKNAWFDLQTLNVEEAIHDRCEGLDAADKILRRVIDLEITAGVPPYRIGLFGYSQGAAVVLWCAVRLPFCLACVVSLHGWMPRPTHFQCTQGGAMTPILMCHGEGDPLVPVDGADMTYLLLQNQGCSRLKYIRYEGVGHEFRKVEGEDVRKFLSTYLGEGSLKLPMQGVLGSPSGDFGAMRRAQRAGAGCDPWSGCTIA
jgi:predicted esterase